MKKIKLLLTLLLVFFTSVSIVSAEEKLVCDKTIEVGKIVTCTFTFGDETRMIETNSEYLKIESVSGTGNTQLNDYQSIFKSSGKIKFIAIKSGNAHVYVSSENGIFGYDELEQIIKITEKQSTTTTTTTTKKKSNNNYLTTITIDDKQIEGFLKEKTKYYVSVDNEVNKVKIDAKVEDDSASYEINGPQMLEVGDNEYTIVVTSEDNTTRYYKLIITKQEKLSSNTNISNIKISSYKFSLEGNSKTYHLKINENDDKLNIIVKLEDENANYEIEGNSNLQNDSIIKIIITAENGDTDTYRIIINKDEKTNYLTYIIIGISTLVIILLIIFMLFIKNNKKKNNKTSNNEKNILNEDIEKTIEISSSKEDDKNIDNDENENTKIVSFDEQDDLEKTKVIELNTEIDKALEDTFE